MKEYTFRTSPELSPEEWWEVPMSSKLGKKIRMYYPWITPVVDEAGKLTDVEIQLPGGGTGKAQGFDALFDATNKKPHPSIGAGLTKRGAVLYNGTGAVA